MNKLLGRIALIVLGLALAGFLFVWSGLIGISASSGHWAITDWFLHYAMRQSVETHALGIAVPPLDDAGLVRRGAGHYQTGCAPCHGAPGAERNPVVLAMTPRPPDLVPKIAAWKASELFWIVKHGIKFTAMPAWPARHRDDEVWAMVAFLREIPRLDATGYKSLAFGRSAGTARVPALADLQNNGAGSALADCVRCHGEHGAGDENGAFPRLDIQNEAYLLAALRAYSAGKRKSGIMQTAVSNLSDATLQDLARHYSAGVRDAGSVPPDTAPAALREQGQRIAEYGDRADKIPVCASCHEAEGKEHKNEYPVLAGQYRSYITGQLELFRKGEARGGADFSRLMRIFSHRLSDAHIGAVAAYYASLPPRDP